MKKPEEEWTEVVAAGKKSSEISTGIRTSKFKFNMREQLLRNKEE